MLGGCVVEFWLEASGLGACVQDLELLVSESGFGASLNPKPLWPLK